MTQDFMDTVERTLTATNSATDYMIQQIKQLNHIYGYMFRTTEYFN